MRVNLRKSFESEAARCKDSLQFAVKGWDDGDDDKYDEHKTFPARPWGEVAKEIDYEYDAGYGSVDCHAVIAWGVRCVYYVHEYDGATHVASMPRHPVNCSPSYEGAEFPI